MITLADVRSSQALVKDLEWSFDFSLKKAPGGIDWIRLRPPRPFTVIAGEGAGGVFLAYGAGDLESLPILHCTSEGQAGGVAANLTEWLALLMAIPYWRDPLKFSGGGQLAEMRKTAVFMEKVHAENYQDLPAARQRIMSVLSIPLLDDPIRLLHDNVHATDCAALAADGWECESLFNTFVSSDNPSWR